MIYVELLIGFLKVGCFAFGGAYGAIPLIREVVLSYGWIDEEMLTYMIAVSESTPGPIMVNLATYIGSSQAGLLGALIATTAVIIPSFLVILVVVAILKNALKNPYIQAMLKGVKPCILATGLHMVIRSCIDFTYDVNLDLQAVVILILLVVAMSCYKYMLHKKLSPILLIVISAFAGIVIYGI